MLGGMKIGVDGRELDFSKAVSYKGMMFGGVPNLAYALGYTDASWTLKATSSPSTSAGCWATWTSTAYTRACRVTPTLSLETQPLIDLTSGLRAALHR